MAKAANLPAAQQPDITPEQMCEMVGSIEKLRELPKCNWNDPDELEARVKYFFEFCIERQLRPGVELLALCIGVSRISLWKWQQAGGAKGEIIDRAKAVIAALLEQWSLQGKLNPTTSIFLLKNHFGYRDEQTLEVTPVNKLEALPTAEQVVKMIPQDDFEQDVEIEL
jgi:hypothetical protein